MLRTKPLACQITPLIQRQPMAEEEEALQAKSAGDPISTQRQPVEEEEEQMQRQPLEEEDMQMKGENGRWSGSCGPGLHSRIRSLKGGGSPLPRTECAFFGSRFGCDFSRVRIHDDSRAAEMATVVNAQAFTHGNDIVFGPGRFCPRSAAGRQLLAHELTHVVQQGEKGFAAPVVQRAETDTRGLCRGLADGCDALNAFVNSQIRQAHVDAFRPRGRSTLPQPIRPMAVVQGTYRRLGALLPIMSHLPIIADWANNHLPNRSHGVGGYGGGSGTKYAQAPGRLLLYLAPAVNLNGNCVGTDKIDHMFHVGYRYFQIFQRQFLSNQSTVGQAAASRRGERYARAWGEWSEGVLSTGTTSDPALMAWLRSLGTPLGGFGITATGVHSRGDLAANDAGLRFYRALYANPAMTFDIRRFVTGDWDEERSGNIYRSDVGAAVGREGRLNPTDVVLP